MKKHMNEDFCQAVIQRALSASKIAIITHMNPDGDGICSARAVQILLRTFGKDSCLFNEFGCPENLRFLLGNTPVFTDKEPGAEGYDLVLTSDCGSAVSYTHLDVYKRQFGKGSTRIGRWFHSN